MFGVIVEIILLYIFQYPGAFIRWTLNGFKKEFKYYKEKDIYLNGTIGLVFIVLLTLGIKKLIN